jgi:hypothetical protein
MATFSATDLNTKARFMGGYGNAVIVYGTVSPTAGASADVYRPLRIPAGMVVCGLDIVNDDLDTGGTAMSASIGYAPVDSDGPTASAAYFSATGTFLTAAGRKVCAFQPIKFEKDVYITLTLTVAATTFATGLLVTAIAKGQAEGVK